MILLKILRVLVVVYQWLILETEKQYVLLYPTTLHTGQFSILLLSSADPLFKINSFKNSFRNTIRESKSLDPDQDQQNVGPDLGSNI